MLMPSLRESFEDVMAAAEGRNLLISHSVTFATPLVAEMRKLPWLSVVLQPSVMFLSWIRRVCLNCAS